MPNNKRKYDFESNVKVPDIDEISRIAKDFSDPTISNGNVKSTEPLSKRGQVAKLGAKLTEAQKQMQLLAREVIKEEQNKDKDDSEDTEVASTAKDSAATIPTEVSENDEISDADSSDSDV